MDGNKKLGVFALAAIVVSAMIGGGIFSLPQNMAQSASSTAIALAWLITGTGIFFLANTFRILANACPDETTGICYNAERVEELLTPSVDRIHFDEAWYAYTRFNPVYEKHFAMRGDPKKRKGGATVFTAQSTHKLLNALSQASYIHVRNGKNSIGFDRFNQAYMINATTSPLYAICVSNDISSAMMYHSGESLIQEVIAEVVDSRQACAKLYHEAEKSGRWFFKPWNADTVNSGKVYDFSNAQRELLIRDQNCWWIRKGEAWHGFKELTNDEWVMLDPIKVSILAPGMGEDGKMQDQGVPAALVSYYLYQEGIIPTRSASFQIMSLFSMGITKGKWGTPPQYPAEFQTGIRKEYGCERCIPCTGGGKSQSIQQNGDS